MRVHRMTITCQMPGIVERMQLTCHARHRPAPLQGAVVDVLLRGDAAEFERKVLQAALRHGRDVPGHRVARRDALARGSRRRRRGGRRPRVRLNDCVCA